MPLPIMNGIARVVEVDFGIGSDMAIVPILDANTRATSQVFAVLGGASSDHDPEDGLLEGLLLNATIQPGVGYTVYAHAPNGTWGRYNVNVSCIYY